MSSLHFSVGVIRVGFVGTRSIAAAASSRSSERRFVVVGSLKRNAIPCTACYTQRTLTFTTLLKQSISALLLLPLLQQCSA